MTAPHPHGTPPQSRPPCSSHADAGAPAANLPGIFGYSMPIPQCTVDGCGATDEARHVGEAHARLDQLIADGEYVRRAALVLDERFLRHVLQIPADLTIRTVYVEPDPLEVRVVLEGQRFAAVPAYDPAPNMPPLASVRIDVDGVTYQRLQWTP